MKVHFPVLSFLVGLIAALVAIKWHWSPLGIAVAVCSFLLVFSLRMFRSRKALKDQRMGKARQRHASISSFLRRIAVAEVVGFVLVVLLAHFLFGVALRLPEPYVGKMQAIAAWPIDRAAAISQIKAAITNEEYGEARGLVAMAYRKSYIDTETRDSLISSIDKAEKPAEIVTNTVIQTETVVVMPTATPAPQPRDLGSISIEVRSSSWDDNGAGPWSATFTVFDGSGAAITDLESKDFMAVVDGLKQDFTMGSGETQVGTTPQQVVFVVDTSGSMMEVGLDPIRAGIAQFGTMDRAEWRFGLVQCGGEQPRALTNGLNNFAGLIDPMHGLRVVDQSRTPLFAAIVMAANMVGQGGNIVVFTDGANTSSTHINLQQAIDTAQASGVRVHVVGLVTGDYAPAPMQAIAQATGGVYLDTPDTAALAGLFGQVAESLFTYSLSGYSTSSAPKVVIGANNAVIDLETNSVITDQATITSLISYR